jgi:citronellol/citronellal dehydrogenase
MGKLDNRVAIVTGASRGIGAWIARRFAAEGAGVAIVARTERAEDSKLPGTIRDTLDTIVGQGGRAHAIRADITRPDDRRRIVAETEAHLGPIDILVNNAALTVFRTVERFDARRYQLMFDVQVWAPFELCQLVLPGMRERHRGWILNITSKAGIHPTGPPFAAWSRSGHTVYGMCKAALDRFTTGLAAECYDARVAVNSLGTEGLVVTPGTNLLGFDPEAMKALVEPPECMPEAALILCTGDPAELTGRIVYSETFLAERGVKPGPIDARPA